MEPQPGPSTQTAIPPLEERWNPRFSLAKLTDPNRVETILSHRADLGGFHKMYKKMDYGIKGHEELPSENDTVNPGGEAKLPKSFKKLKSIKMEDMDPDFGIEWDGCKIELEIIEDAMSFTRGMLLGQDKLGEVVWVALYDEKGLVDDPRFQQKLGFGTKITIAAPYLKIALDGRTMIRLEDHQSLFIHKDKDMKRCRFCTKPNSVKSCAKCKKAYYCSKQCQTHDWKILKHKDLCGAYKWIDAKLKEYDSVKWFEDRFGKL